jgi:hypothetical protein
MLSLGHRHCRTIRSPDSRNRGTEPDLYIELGGEVLRSRLWPQVHFSVPRPLLLFQNS